jgi:hypothetical protein
MFLQTSRFFEAGKRSNQIFDYKHAAAAAAPEKDSCAAGAACHRKQFIPACQSVQSAAKKSLVEHVLRSAAKKSLVLQARRAGMFVERHVCRKTKQHKFKTIYFMDKVLVYTELYQNKGACLCS